MMQMGPAVQLKSGILMDAGCSILQLRLYSAITSGADSAASGQLTAVAVYAARLSHDLVVAGGDAVTTSKGFADFFYCLI